VGVFFGIIGFRRFWSGALAVYLFYFAIPLLSLWGFGQRSGPEHDDQTCQPSGTGPASGRQRKFEGDRRIVRAHAFLLSSMRFSSTPAIPGNCLERHFFLAALLMVINGLLALFVLQRER
jgi:hypothetical protein